MDTIQHQLHQLCLAFISQRINTAEQAIAQAREAANDDTKSSAGDKFETTREMMQQDIDRNKKLLTDAQLQRQVLERYQPEGAISRIAKLGSIIYTNNGNFYLSISAGALEVNGAVFYAISSASPIGAALLGKTVNDTFTFNGRNYLIEQIIN